MPMILPDHGKCVAGTATMCTIEFGLALGWDQIECKGCKLVEEVCKLDPLGIFHCKYDCPAKCKNDTSKRNWAGRK